VRQVIDDFAGRFAAERQRRMEAASADNHGANSRNVLSTHKGRETFSAADIRGVLVPMAVAAIVERALDPSNGWRFEETEDLDFLGCQLDPITTFKLGRLGLGIVDDETGKEHIDGYLVASKRDTRRDRRSTRNFDLEKRLRGSLREKTKFETAEFARAVPTDITSRLIVDDADRAQFDLLDTISDEWSAELGWLLDEALDHLHPGRAPAGRHSGPEGRIAWEPAGRSLGGWESEQITKTFCNIMAGLFLAQGYGRPAPRPVSRNRPGLATTPDAIAEAFGLKSEDLAEVITSGEKAIVRHDAGVVALIPTGEPKLPKYERRGKSLLPTKPNVPRPLSAFPLRMSPVPAPREIQPGHRGLGVESDERSWDRDARATGTAPKARLDDDHAFVRRGNAPWRPIKPSAALDLRAD
jgi:hypothetical protein